jgi:hypothetical protein
MTGAERQEQLRSARPTPRPTMQTDAGLVAVTGLGSSSPWSPSPSPTCGSAPAPRPRPPPPGGSCRHRPATTAGPAGPPPRPGSLRERLGNMLRLLAPHHHGEERRLGVAPLLAVADPARHREPEHRPGNPGAGVAQLGVVGEVAGKRHARLGHGVPPAGAWPGGAALPLERDRVEGVGGVRPVRAGS